jgi:hypothetical protein
LVSWAISSFRAQNFVREASRLHEESGKEAPGDFLLAHPGDSNIPASFSDEADASGRRLGRRRIGGLLRLLARSREARRKSQHPEEQVDFVAFHLSSSD